MCLEYERRSASEAKNGEKMSAKFVETCWDMFINIFESIYPYIVG